MYKTKKYRKLVYITTFMALFLAMLTFMPGVFSEGENRSPNFNNGNETSIEVYPIEDNDGSFEATLVVYKYVWDPATGGWVDYTEAQVCTYVDFMIEVYNYGSEPIYDIWVYDDMDPCLEYVPESAVPPPTYWDDHYLEWTTGFTLDPDYYAIFTFSAHVTECGINENWASADGFYGDLYEYVYDDDYVTVMGSGIPSIDVEKYVWDPSTSSWVQPGPDYPLDVPYCTIIEFKIIVHNDGVCCPLTDIWVYDFMEDSLELVDWDIEPNDIYYVSGGTEIGWNFPGPLEPCNTIEIHLWAHVVGEPCSVDMNYVYAEGYCQTMDQWVSDEDEVYVHVTEPHVHELELFKYVWDPATGWVDYTEAQVCTNVHFQIAIHNSGTDIVEDIYVYDMFDLCLEYVPGTATVNGVPYEPDWIWYDSYNGYLEWYGDWSLNPCEWLYIEFDMHVTECGINENWAIAEGWCPICGEYFYSNEDLATVMGLGIPSIDVEKYVWDPSTSSWVQPGPDYPLDVDHCTIIEFMIIVHNDGVCCDLTDIWVYDFMEDSLELVDYTLVPDDIYYVPGGTEIGWNFPGPLEPCNTIEIHLWAHVVGEPCSIDMNYVYAEGYCQIMDEWPSDEDEVYIHVKCVPEVWVDDDYTTSTTGWGLTHFDSISDALEVLEPGGTAHIHKGIYLEDIIVDDFPCDNTGITIVGVEGYPALPKQSAAVIHGTITIKVDDVRINYLMFDPTSDPAITVEGSGAVIQHNIFFKECLADATAIENTGQSMVEARYNYWGAPNGPSGGAIDPNTGKAAEGFGTLILGSNVLFDPWAGVHAQIKASQTEVELGQSILFSSEPYSFAYYIDGTPNEYDVLWDFDDGEYSQDKTIGHVFDMPGTYQVSLRVRASDTSLHPGFMYDWDNITIIVFEPGMPLTPNADSSNLGGYEGYIDTLIQFYGSAVGGTPPYTFEWDFGDSTQIVEEKNPTHKYTKEGTYTATLTVTDSEGNVAYDTSPVAVVESELIEEAEIKGVKCSIGLVKAVIKTGDEPVDWSIDVDGGIVLLGGHNSGNIPEQSEQTVQTPFTFGFGKVDITVTANDLVEKRSAFLLGPFFLG
jgi:uncharacterized repeat protein (TIGR01451 family)